MTAGEPQIAQEQVEAILAQAPLFQSLPPHELRYLADHLRVVELPPGRCCSVRASAASISTSCSRDCSRSSKPWIRACAPG